MPQRFPMEEIGYVIRNYFRGIHSLPEMQAIVLNAVIDTDLNEEDVLEIPHFIRNSL